MPAAKRKGPGRPRKPAAEKAVTWTGSLYPEDLARLRRLTKTYKLSNESETMREALRTMEAVDRAEWLPAAKD